MGSPARSRFATQFVTLLQLQTCCWVHHNNQQSVQIFSKRGYQETLEDHRELEHVMKRRNVLDGKPRRPVKRPNTSSKIGENFYGRYRTDKPYFLPFYHQCRHLRHYSGYHLKPREKGRGN